MSAQHKPKIPSKTLEAKPGVHRYDIGPVHPDGADTNLYGEMNILFYLLAGGWPVDSRGVFFDL